MNNSDSGSSIYYRIRIGVTGIYLQHDAAGLAEGLRAVLGTSARDSRILELFGADRDWMTSITHTPVALTFVTTFHEESERLAWKEISKIPDSRVQLVLPFSEKEYETEFTSESAKSDFQNLKQDASLRSPILLRKDAADRQDAMTLAKRYIVDHCDVVIVIGNVQDNDHFVKYAKTKQRPMMLIQSASEIQLIPNFGLNRKSLERLEQYNRRSIAVSRIEKEADAVYRQVFGKAGDRVAAPVKEMIRDLLIPHYARASITALGYQRFYKGSGMLVYAFSAISVGFVACGVIFHLQWTYFVEFLLLITILIAVLISKGRDAQKNWIETRFLAERIRSSMYLAAAGVEASPIYLPPYMGAAHGQDDWMIIAFQDIWGRTPPMHGCSGDQCSLLADFIREAWLDEQIEYHHEKSRSTHKISHLLELGGYILFLAALILAIFHLLLPEGGETIQEQLMVFCALWFPAFAAALEGIRKYNEYSRLATLSENMEEGLRELKQRYQEIRSNDSLDSLLRETDELMLRETQSWLMLMRFVKLEPVL